jgi:hypothetical protein
VDKLNLMRRPLGRKANKREIIAGRGFFFIKREGDVGGFFFFGNGDVGGV